MKVHHSTCKYYKLCDQLLTLSVYSLTLTRHCSLKMCRRLSKFLVRARANGRMDALSTSRFMMLEPAARH